MKELYQIGIFFLLVVIGAFGPLAIEHQRILSNKEKEFTESEKIELLEEADLILIHDESDDYFYHTSRNNDIEKDISLYDNANSLFVYDNEVQSITLADTTMMFAIAENIDPGFWILDGNGYDLRLDGEEVVVELDLSELSIKEQPLVWGGLIAVYVLMWLGMVFIIHTLKVN